MMLMGNFNGHVQHTRPIGVKGLDQNEKMFELLMTELELQIKNFDKWCYDKWTWSKGQRTVVNYVLLDGTLTRLLNDMVTDEKQETWSI